MAVIDPGEKRKAVAQFAEEFSWTFDVLLDRDQSVARRYGVRGHPMTFFIGPNGRLLGVIVGFREWDSTLAFQVIDKLLERI